MSASGDWLIPPIVDLLYKSSHVGAEASHPHAFSKIFRMLAVIISGLERSLAGKAECLRITTRLQALSILQMNACKLTSCL